MNYPNPRNRRRHKSHALLAAAIAALGVPSLHADDTWNNTGTTWNSAGSWVDGTAPANSSNAGNTITFDNLGAGNNSVGFTSQRDATGIIFTSDANAYTFENNGFSLRLGTGGIDHGAANLQTFNVPFVLRGTQSWTTVSGGSLAFSSVALSDTTTNRTLTIAGAGNVTVAGAISPASSTLGTVTVTSTGVTTFNGNNSYFGTTTMNAVGGTLVLNGDNSSATGNVTLTAGTIRLGHANALGSTAGATTVSNFAVLDLNGQSVGAETLTLGGSGIGATGALINGTASAASHSGAISLSSNTTLGTVAGGSITLSGAININAVSALSRTLTFAGDGNYTLTNSLSNSFAGSTGNVATAAGYTGVAILSGVSSYNGSTTVAGGTLYVNGTIAGSGASATGTGRLGGTGTIQASVTIGDTAFLVPGNSAGTLTVGNGLAINGTYAWEIDANSAVSGFDSVILTGGDITLGAGSVFDISALAGVDFSDEFWAENQTWTVIDNTGGGSISGTFLGGLTGVTSNSFGSFSLGYGAGAGGDVTLSWTASAVPEPSAFAALAGVAAFGLVALRRRRA